MRKHMAYATGKPVVYHVTKQSCHPGPRARNITPLASTDNYSYVVDKFWTVVQRRGSAILVKTRRGKWHLINLSDPNLRPASLWERIRYRHRFPAAPFDLPDRNDI